MNNWIKDCIGLGLSKRKQIVNLGANILSFVVVYLISRVCFSVDHRFPEPYEMAKFLKLVSLIPIISVSGLILTLFNQNMRFTLLDLFSLLFLAYYLISVFVRGAGDPRHLLLPIALASIYIIVRATASGGSDGLKWVVLAILYVSIFESILGIKQIFGYVASNHHLYSVTGSFFNPGPFGGYLAFIFALSLPVLIRMQRKIEELLLAVKQRKFKELISIDVPLYFVSFVAFILSFILLPATMSRSAWMAVCVVVSLIAIIEIGIFKKIQNWFSKHKRLLIPLSSIATGLVIATIISIYMLKKDSADSRLFSWQISAKVIAANPVTGVGTGYFGGAYANQQALYFAENPESKYLYAADCPAYAFNEYLQIGSELGLVGLVLFVMITILALWCVFKKPNPFHYAFIAILVFAFTSYPFHLVPLLVLLIVSIAAQESKTLSGCLTGRTLFAVISVAVFAVWMGTHPLMKDHTKAQIEWQKLQTLFRMETYDNEGYEEIYPILKYDHKFLFDYGHSLNKVDEHGKSNEILHQGAELSNDPMFHNVMGNNYLALKEYDHAEKSYNLAYHIVPSRIYPLYLLAKLYLEQGDTVKTMYMCRKVMGFRPKVHSTAVTELKAEIEELMYQLDSQ
jgi:O-antigen ligase